MPPLNGNDADQRLALVRESLRLLYFTVKLGLVIVPLVLRASRSSALPW